MKRVLRQRGSALLMAIIVVLMLAAIGAAATLTARMESLLTIGFNQSQEALLAADGGLARAVQDLSPLSDWSPVLSGAASTFTDGSSTGSRRLPGGDVVVLCCGAGSLSDELQQRAFGGATRGANTPQWRLFAWGPVSSWIAGGRSSSAYYVAIWVADDVEDGDGVPLTDTNGRIVVHAIGLGPNHVQRSVQATVEHARDTNGVPLSHGVSIVSRLESRW